MSKPAPRGRTLAWALLLAMLTTCAALWAVSLWPEAAQTQPQTQTQTQRNALADEPATPQAIERGKYLAQVGHCAGCHSTPGSAPYAGGPGLATPFGTLHAGNLTPDMTHGLGRWRVAQFASALRDGRAPDGRLLYPAFPYQHFSLLTDADVRALYAYFQSLAAEPQPNVSHELRWPYSTQAALAVWRALYFRPTAWVDNAQQSALWNQGAYWVQGLAHCGACHAPRNRWGASVEVAALLGGKLPSSAWQAPSLRDPHEAGVQGWTLAQVSHFLQSGVGPQGSVVGPMASVVMGSLQHLNEPDALAMATYLRSLPQASASPSLTTQERAPPAPQQMQNGERVYEQHCAQCHGAAGRGKAGAYAALAGTRKVLAPNAANLVQVVLWGGFGPSTKAHPRPYGMPPFVQILSQQEVADVLTFVRQSWGNQAGAVSAGDVQRYR